MKRFLCSVCIILLMTLLACAGDALADGEYKVNITLEGGSGRASLTSPTELVVRDGQAYATLEWSSSNYDYMIVDGEKYLPINESGNSVFEIPVSSFDEPIEVIADTTAMSKPHEITYQITISKIDDEKAEDDTQIGDSGLAARQPDSFVIPDKIGDSLKWKNSEKILYAKGFSIDYYEDENNKAIYTLLTIYDDGQYLIIDDDKRMPELDTKDIKVLSRPDKIYLVASSAMDMFDKIDAMNTLRYCALNTDSWYIEAAKTRMNSKELIYAGKYSAPDYELIVDGGCDLAIENTMIYHTPQVKEKLEAFGIPVMVDRSSYESDPMGRIEWVKLYGAMTNSLDKANKIFDEQLSIVNEIDRSNKRLDTTPTVAFFYVSTNGTIKVRKTNDYISKMIDMAGGKYIFENLGIEDESASSTMSLQMEEFYATAKDADYLIYNSTVDGELDSIDDLIAKNALFSKFKAVSNGNVYCTSENLYQSSMELGTIINDINKMLSSKGDMEYIYKLR